MSENSAYTSVFGTIFLSYNCYYEKTISEVKNITDEIPFDIPDSWCWVRLSSLSSISAGGTPERGNPNYWANGTIPWLKISDITSSKKFVNSCTEYITDEGMQNSSAKILPKGTILYTIFATIGEVGILGINASCNQAIAGIQTYLRSIDGYLYYYLVNLQDFMKSISKGCAQFNINQKILKEAFVPLPPLAEQERIVAEIEKFEPLIAEYDKLEQQATKLDSEIYDKLKKSILQYAIQGKLVPQNSNDEPASVLLERIRAEKKAQLGKKYVESYIYKGDDNCYYEKVGKNEPVLLENLPFDIPDSWCWARLENAADINPRNNIDDNLDVSFVEMKSIMDGFNNVFCYKKRKWRDVKSGFTHFKNGDVGFAKITPCFQNRKSVVFHGLENCYGAGTTELHILRAYSDTIFVAYLLYFVKSPYFIEHGKINFSGTAGQQRFGTDAVKRTFIPIPPYNEQIRICNQIEVMLGKLKDEN